MKLEVGMYIRTKKGIAKITSMLEEPNRYIVYTDNKDVVFEYYRSNYLKDGTKWFTDYVDKANHNIIDLIEVGDYVNGYKVINVGIGEDGHKYIDLDFDKECDELHWGEYGSLENNEDIQSIVTKEQFESMQYELNERRVYENN